MYKLSFALKLFLLSLAFTASSLPARAQQKTAVESFERYASDVEAELDNQLSGHSSLPKTAWTAEDRKKVQSGEILIRKVELDGYDFPGAMLHDWVGSMLVSGVTAREVVDLLVDYDRHKGIYPEVLDSRLLDREGNRLKGFLQLKKKKIITVVLNTEHELEIKQIADGKWQLRSLSTRISEVKDFGEPDQRELPPGQGDGFMWFLNAYWQLEEAPEGVYTECRAISLSRNIPWALRWLIKPFVTSIPRESLVSTMEFSRKALAAHR